MISHEREIYIRRWAKSTSEPLACRAMEELLQEIDGLRTRVGAANYAIQNAYQQGWRESAESAVALCEGRANVKDKNLSLQQEARKCASTISHVLLETDPCPYCKEKGFVGVNLDHPQTMLCQWCSGNGRVKKNSATNNSTECSETPSSSADSTHTRQ